jgi:imidazoleglycerol-phosphate dehydratase
MLWEPQKMNNMRKNEFQRTTNETNVSVSINLDGTGISQIKTDFPFLNHILASFATHGMIDLQLEAIGDLHHHIVEDIALCLGKVILQAVKQAPNINRFGFASIPMDCSLANCSLDLGNRPYAIIDLKLESPTIEGMASEDLIHFMESFAQELRANIHLHVQYGKNDHHKIEAAVKSLAISLRKAVKLDSRRRGVPSSKGEIK